MDGSETTQSIRITNTRHQENKALKTKATLSQSEGLFYVHTGVKANFWTSMNLKSVDELHQPRIW